MKKVFALPIMAIGLMVSLSWGAEWQLCTGSYAGFCKFPSGDACNKISIQPGESWSKNTCKEAYDNCIEYGFFYTDEDCTVWGNKGNNPNFNGGVSLWCQWTTGCQPITNDSGLDNCKTNGTVYRDVSSSDVGEGKECKNSGTWTGQGKDPNKAAIGCCNWDGNGCFKVFEESEWADCAQNYRYASCPGDESGTCTGSPMAIISSYNSTPIAGLNVVHFARSLQISSGRDATVALFDINGKQVLSQKVLSGTTTISLENQKLGVYYAVVKADLQKQTVKIILK